MQAVAGPAILLLALATGLQAQASPPETLAALERTDRALARGVTMEVEIRTPEEALRPERGEEIRVGTITTDGGAIAISTQSSYTRAPEFREAVDRADRELNFNDNGELIAWRYTRRDTVSMGSVNETSEEIVPFRVSPGRVLEEKAHASSGLQRYDAGDDNNLRDYHFTLMALGRGYSRHLHTIVSSERTPAGLLSIEAKGQFGPASLGSWRLLLDPKAGYLARSASYTADGMMEPSLVMEAGGPALGQKSSLASHGTLRFVLGAGQSFTFSAKLLALTEQTNPALLAQVQERVASASVFGARVWDRRQKTGAGVSSRDVVPVDEDVPIDPVPLDPCCVCQEFSHTFHECGHHNPPLDFLPCSSDWCIENIIDSATCIQTAPTGENKCFQVSIPSRPGAVQIVRQTPGATCPTGGQRVRWRVEFTNYSGCSGCTPTVPDQGLSACNIGSCAGVELARTSFGAARDCAPGAVVVN